MKLEKFNPFVTARLNAEYTSQDKLAKAIGVSRPTYSQWERGTYASVYEHNLAGFKKMCDIFGWTYEEGLNNLSNLNKWRKDPNINIVNPTIGQAKAIAKTWKPNLATLDTSNTDISKEQEMLNNPLKIWRGQKNLTRSEAAKLCNVDINVYSDCEDGVKKPNGFDLTKILKGTGLGFVDIQKIFRDDNTVKNAIENALAAQSKQEISYVKKPEEPKPTYSYGEKIGEIKLDENGYPYTEFEIDDNDIKPDPDEPEVIASPITPEEFTTLNNKEVEKVIDDYLNDGEVTERDEDGKPIAGRYIFQDSDGHVRLTREGERKAAEYKRKAYMSCVKEFKIPEDIIKREALNEPHDFRDEVIDEVLEKMYGQMDYKKYVYLVGLLGR